MAPPTHQTHPAVASPGATEAPAPPAGPPGPSAPAPPAARLKALVTAFLFPDWARLPGIYTAHVPTYVLRSPTDPYGVAYRQLLARDVAARLATLEEVCPGAAAAINPAGVGATLLLYSKAYGANTQRTFGQYFALKAAEHAVHYLRGSPAGREPAALAARLERALGAGRRGGGPGAPAGGSGRERAPPPDPAAEAERRPLVQPLRA